LGNFFVSEGKKGKVLKILVKHRISDVNFITAIRNSLIDFPEVDNNKQIGLGGITFVNNGKIKYHVMPDFKNTPMKEGKEIEDWLKFYTCGPDLILLSTLITGDPTINNLNLRLEHTHFFSKDGNYGGHYH